MALLAYHGDETLKARILARIGAHRAADQLVKGKYWQNGKGCAVGCTIHTSDHSAYERLLGIPVVLAHLEDRIFEKLSNGDAMLWPERFIGAIRVGADLSRVGWRFLHWLLTDKEVNFGIEHPLVRDEVRACARLMADFAEGRGSADAARRAVTLAGVAWGAAETARRAWAGAAADAARSAATAAETAARSENAPRAAASAAWSAAWSVVFAGMSAEDANAAAKGAGHAAYARMADKLVSLLEAA